jgi:two-component system, NtrC family, sensor kinase
VTAPRNVFRFGLPPSLPVAPAPGATGRLTRVLSGIVGRQVAVVTYPDDEGLTDGLRRGEVDAAWAPPLVAARAEALGARILARPLRRGSVRSRSALLVRTDSPLQLETLPGTTAAWVDRASLAGHLLPMAWLRERGPETGKLFGQQLFLGSYQACIEALLEGQAEVAPLFAPPEGHDLRSGWSAGSSRCASSPRERRSSVTCSAPSGWSARPSSATASSSAATSRR